MAALAIAGTPPFNIFWGKMMLIVGGYCTGSPTSIPVSTARFCESTACFAQSLRGGKGNAAHTPVDEAGYSRASSS